MTTPTNPGSIPSDPMAVERLRTLLGQVRGHNSDSYRLAAPEMDLFPSVTFIHDVNSAGVLMRRVVAYGEWEMDPNPPAGSIADDRRGVACCHRHIDSGEAEACCENCPDRLPFRLV